jgi:hypothetical protein
MGPPPPPLLEEPPRLLPEVVELPLEAAAAVGVTVV